MYDVLFLIKKTLFSPILHYFKIYFSLFKEFFVPYFLDYTQKYSKNKKSNNLDPK